MSDRFDPYYVWLGIPPEEQPPNHYRLLGLRLFETNPDVISNALDQRRTFLRSVAAGKRAAQSQRLLNEVSTAGVYLLDTAKKGAYDEQLRISSTSMASREFDVCSADALPPPASVMSPAAAAPIPPVPRVNGRLPAGSKNNRRPATAMTAAMVVVATAALVAIAGAGAWWATRPSIPPARYADGDSRVNAQVAAERATPTTNGPAAAQNPENHKSAAPGDGLPGPAVASRASGGSSQRVALVFSGNETVQVPLPQEITATDAAFTIEVWALWDRYEPAGRLLGSGPFRLHSTAVADNAKGDAFNLIHLGAGGSGVFRRGGVAGGRWAHLALQRDADEVELFVNGSLSLKLKPRGELRLGTALILGDVASQNPAAPRFAGLIRDVRVSKIRRYSESFTPETRFSRDDQTVVLLNLAPDSGPDFKINNLAGQTLPAELSGARLAPLSAEGDLAAQLPDGTIDLLQSVNVSRATLEGEVIQTNAYIETQTAQGLTRVLLPYRPPAEYEVEMDITREEGSGGALMGLEIAGRPAILAIDIFDGTDRRTGLLPLDSKSLIAAPQLQRARPVLADGQRRPVLVKTQIHGLNYTIIISQSGSEITSISGPLDTLGCAPEYSIPLRHGMSLGSSGAKIRFERTVLRPTKVQFSPEVIAQMPRPEMPGNRSLAQPATKSGNSATTAPSNSSPSPTLASALLAGGRHVVPAGDALAKAIEEARKIYEADFKLATKAPQKAALARRIFETGKTTENDPTARYVLVDLARKVLIQAGEVTEALAAAQLLESDYDIPREELAGATIEALDDAPLSTEQRAELAKAAADQADASLDDGQYERADKLSVIASQSAGRQRDPELKKEMAQRRAHVVKLVKEWNTVKTSIEKLKGDPADAAANLAAGKFYCFTLEDFNRGLSFLAACGDASLAEAAKRDQAAQRGDATKKLEAAGAWQQAAAKINDRDDKLAVQRREKWFLQQASAGLSGLEQIKANKRLEELNDVGQVRAKTTTSGGSSRAAAKARNASMVGRLVSGATDAGLLVTYEHGYVITGDDFSRMLKAANISNPQNLKMALVGGFYLPTDQNITIHQVGEDSGGTHTVQIDNRPQNTVSGGNNNVIRNVRLAAGNHMVRWELTGSNFGTALLELRSDPAATGGAPTLIPIAVDRSVESAAARQGPTRASIHFGPSR